MSKPKPTPQSQTLGTESIGKLLTQQAIPASIGILMLSIYLIVDTIFVGRYVGPVGIAAITVVMPITFLISAIGMAVGVGGASIISRALGANDRPQALLTFGNMISLTLVMSFLIIGISVLYSEPLLRLFGANGNILPYAQSYFNILILGIPFLTLAMMSNPVIRAEGQAKMAMLTLLIPAFTNLILDPFLIAYLDWGIEGAAWATSFAYLLSGSYIIWYFVAGKRSELELLVKNLKLRWSIIREITAIGGVTLARQGTISLLTVVLNQSLFVYGGELAIAIYGIINRVMMFVNFPVMGITQGFLPIAGFNYGAEKWQRVRKTIILSVAWGTGIATGLFILVVLFATPLVQVFTLDASLLEMGPPALVIAFLATPLITIQLVGAAYFQAIGKALPALLLTLTKQGFFLIPLILLLPLELGLDGIWWAFPVADCLSAAVTYWYLKREMKATL
ncbi:MAG: MATE family efflux transporter [Chitinophagales bacterium]